MNASCPVHVLVYSRGSLFHAISRKKCIHERKIVRFSINFALCYIYNCLLHIFSHPIYFESRFKRRQYHYKKNKIWKFHLQKTFSELSIASSSSSTSSRPHIQLLHSLFITIITYYNKTLRDH